VSHKAFTDSELTTVNKEKKLNRKRMEREYAS